MTIELRTDVPLCNLIIRNQTYPGGRTLRVDPFDEMKNHLGHKDRLKEHKLMEELFQRYQKTGNQERYTSELEAWNKKYGMVYSVFIDGLDEDKIVNWFDSFDVNEEDFFKGTRFMGIDKSSISITAKALKIGLPDKLKVKIGVKFKWTLMDLVNYGVAIRTALENEGVTQLNQGYTGKNSQIPGRGIHSN